jgi:hypothetical protein
MLSILASILLLAFAACSVSASFDWGTANTSVWLAAGAYCETNTYMSRPYKGYSAGFVPYYVIDDKTYDVQVCCQYHLIFP